MCITTRAKLVQSHPEQHHHQACHLQPHLPQHPCNHHYKQTSCQPPLQEPDSHSVFTVEMGSRKLPRGLLQRDSEPLYQEIGERIKDGSDSSENRSDILNKRLSHNNEKLYDQRYNVNDRDLYMKPWDKAQKITIPVNPKPNIVYGVITAKEAAKFRPCTQDIVLRPEVK